VFETRCEVLIVGGGPAGSTCARQLTRAGFDVVILDKSQFPRDKVCAGWITPQVIEEVELDLADYGRSRTLQPITSFIAGLGEYPAQRVRYDREVSYGIRRSEFDEYLLRRSGARLMLGESLSSLERCERGWRINDRIEAQVLIGAGGHFCPVARSLGAQLGKGERAIYAQEIEFELSEAQARSCAVLPEQPELYFSEDLRGYGWCFRKGRYLNVGLGREGNHQLAQQVHSFAEWLTKIGRIPPDMPSRFKGHAYLLYSHTTRRVYDDRVLLIGDAAGLAYPQSGEGIRPAIESGLIAAQVLRETRGDYRRERLVEYDRRLRARFGERATTPVNSSLLPERLRSAIARSLMRTQWFTRKFVLDRWFLHANQPALAVNRGE
jgi:geranylgeranyl reductase family protein